MMFLNMLLRILNIKSITLSCTKIFSISEILLKSIIAGKAGWVLIIHFWKLKKKKFRVGVRIRVGRVTRTTHIFLFGLREVFITKPKALELYFTALNIP
jgi:hypothetical protein